MKMMLLTLGALAIGARMMMKSGRLGGPRSAMALPSGIGSGEDRDWRPADTSMGGGGSLNAAEGLQQGHQGGAWSGVGTSSTSAGDQLFPRTAPGGKPASAGDDIDPGLPDFSRGG